MTYKIYVTPYGEPNIVNVLEYHLNHNIEDIDPRIAAAVALMDATLVPEDRRTAVYMSLDGVGTKLFKFDAFDPDVYFISQEFINAHNNVGQDIQD